MTKRTELKNLYTYVEPGKEKEWRALVKKNQPKAEIRSNGAGTLLATLPGVPYWKAKVGHFKLSLGGFVIKKGAKPL